MKLTLQQFEETKTRILLMDSAQKAEIQRLLGARVVNGSAKKIDEKGNTPGFRLHKVVQQVLFSRVQSNIPSLDNLKRVQPNLHRRFEEVGRYFEEELTHLFPKITTQEHWGLIHYFVKMASHRLDDLDKTMTASNLLDALVPLAELVDDQLPGYRSSGILQPVVLQHLSREQPCLARTP